MSKKSNYLPALEPTLPEREGEEFHFVLGKRDREMMLIEEMLRKTKQRFQYATHNGQLVTPRNCYQADPVVVTGGRTVVFVECESTQLLGFCGVPRVIDHHREFDPGFGIPPEHYWEASSIGQTWILLRRHHRLKQPGKAYLIAAARDHCRFAAARGECPKITPEEVTVVGKRWIAEELGVPRSRVESRTKKMVEVIDKSPVITIGKQEVVDLRRFSVSEIYSLDYFSIYEALAELSCAAIIKTGNLSGQNDKFVLMGDVVASTVKHFISTWGPSVGLKDIYGCEVRGHAGGYLNTQMALVA